MVTRGSWATPHTMEAWVPLMTLWSWGGLVMRVRAGRQQAGSEGRKKRVGSGVPGERQGGGKVSAGDRPAGLNSVGDAGRPTGEQVDHSERPRTGKRKLCFRDT